MRLGVTLNVQYTACLVLFILRPCPAIVLVKKQGLFSCGKAGQIGSPHTVVVSNTWNFILLHYLRPRRKEGRKKGGKKKGRSQKVSESMGTQPSTQIASILYNCVKQSG